MALLRSRNAHDKGDGRTATLVLCSRNARPQKGLVRRPHLDQHGCSSKREKRASLEEPLIDRRMCSFDARTRGSTRLPLIKKQGIGKMRSWDQPTHPL